MSIVAYNEAREKAAAFTSGMPGWLTEAEGAWLFDAAAACRHAIVEIGSWKGKSTVWLGLGSQAGHGVAVHAIDPHCGSAEHQHLIDKEGTYPEFRRNIEQAGVSDVVRAIVATSEQAARDWTTPIGLLFVDGAHEYEAVASDLRMWLPHVVEGGVVGVHDSAAVPLIPWATRWPGPQRATRELIVRAGGFEAVRLIDTMLVATRVTGGKVDQAQQLLLDARRTFLSAAHYWTHSALGLKLPRWVRSAGKRLVVRATDFGPR